METTLKSRQTQVSLEVFGTPDFQSVLSVLPPYDGAVREFHRRVSLLEKGAEANG